MKMKKIWLIFIIVIIFVAIGLGFIFLKTNYFGQPKPAIPPSNTIQTTLKQIESAPWNWQDKIVEITISKVNWANQSSCIKSAALTCCPESEPGKLDYVSFISDDTSTSEEGVAICTKESTNFTLPTTIKAKVYAEVKCQKYEPIAPEVSGMRCVKKYSSSSRNPSEWNYILVLQ